MWLCDHLLLVLLAQTINTTVNTAPPPSRRHTGKPLLLSSHKPNILPSNLLRLCHCWVKLATLLFGVHHFFFLQSCSYLTQFVDPVTHWRLAFAFQTVAWVVGRRSVPLCSSFLHGLCTPHRAQSKWVITQLTDFEEEKISDRFCLCRGEVLSLR